MARVLVVNDLGFVRHHLSTLLKQLGHDSICVGDGEAALARLRRDFQISDVLADLSLRGGLSAVEVLNSSRTIVRLTDSGENATGPRVWVLASVRDNMIPGFPNVELEVAAAQLGFSGILTKPVSIESLEAALSSFPAPANSNSRSDSRSNSKSNSKSSHPDAAAGPLLGSLDQRPAASDSRTPGVATAVDTLASFAQLLKTISGKSDTAEQILATIDREIQRITHELVNRD
jgi:CheY-like chemotaxis protein